MGGEAPTEQARMAREWYTSKVREIHEQSEQSNSCPPPALLNLSNKRVSDNRNTRERDKGEGGREEGRERG